MTRDHTDRDECDPIIDGETGEVFDRAANGDGTPFEYHVTVPRRLARQVVEHYRAHDDVRSVPDALRHAARDVSMRTNNDAPTVRCSACGHEFTRDEAASATFDGTTALYQCPVCGTAAEGPAPGR